MVRQMCSGHLSLHFHEILQKAFYGVEVRILYVLEDWATIYEIHTSSVQ